MALWPARVGFCLICALAPNSSVMKVRSASASYPAAAMTWPTPVSPEMSALACGQSPQWPGVISKRTGRPSASTAAWILVVSPPRERPIA